MVSAHPAWKDGALTFNLRRRRFFVEATPWKPHRGSHRGSSRLPGDVRSLVRTRMAAVHKMHLISAEET